MYRLCSALLLALVLAEPRSPKIYNVLISSKKNLSPSHAVPVFEPVLRTTSLGLALPPFFYQSPFIGGGYPAYQPNYVQTLDTQRSPNNNQGPYLPYYSPQVNSQYYAPAKKEVQEETQNVPRVQPSPGYNYQKANLEIPDVPPPPLPVRNIGNS